MFGECVRDCVGTVVLWHKFGHAGFAFAFVIAAAVFGREHHEVANLVDVLGCAVFVGMVCLANFGGEEVVLSLLDVMSDAFPNFVGSNLFRGGVHTKWHERWDNVWGLSCF